jgi:Domain of unknown function (DUF362)
MNVSAGGDLFSQVMVSVSRLRQHSAAGGTLSMKNPFGLIPHSLCGNEAVGEEALVGRGPLNDAPGSALDLPGFKRRATLSDGSPVTHVIVNICAGPPIHLAIIDGITAISGGETPWSRRQYVTTSGILRADRGLCILTSSMGLILAWYHASL